MSAGLYNFTLEQGTTIDFKIQYKDVSGSAINLTGYGGKMQIKSNYADNSPTIYLTLSSSLQADGTGLNFSGSNGSTPTASGSIGVFISADTSSLLTFDTALYDLEITSGSIVTRILEGQVKLSKEVTR